MVRDQSAGPCAGARVNIRAVSGVLAMFFDAFALRFGGIVVVLGDAALLRVSHGYSRMLGHCYTTCTPMNMK